MLRSLLPATSGPLDGAGLDLAYAPAAPRWLRANFAETADGAIEIDGRSGGIGGPADKEVFAHLRSMADVVLVASGTASAERYGSVHLDEAASARRAARGQAAGVPVAVVTNRASLDPGDRLFVESAADGVRPIVLTAASAPAGAVDALRPVADVVVCGDAEVDLAVALAALADRGLDQVLCEGGPTLLRRLVGAGALDELCLTVAPVLAGAGHAGLLPAPDLDPVPLHLIGLMTDGEGTLFARYQVQR